MIQKFRKEIWEEFLVIKYFDTYVEKFYYFKTEEEAKKFEKQKNDENKHYLTEYMYRGKIQK